MAAVSITDVTSEDATAGVSTSYTVEFIAANGIQPGDEITIVFGTGFGVSQQATAEIKYGSDTYKATTSVLGTIVKIYAPAELTVSNGDSVTVTVDGITNPTKSKDYTIALRTTADAAGTAAIIIEPADPVKLVINSSFDENSTKSGIQVTAGSAPTITIGIQDQYGNVTNTASDITVKLSDTAEFEGSGTITSGSSSTTVSWTAPEKAGSYTLTAEDVSEGAATKMQAASVAVEVVADAPAKADISGPGYLNKDQEGTYTITLYDNYGNIATTNSAISFNLTAAPSNGVTFDPNPVSVAANKSSATFKFKSANAGMYAITANGNGISITKNVAVGVTVLNSLAINAPASGEVGIASEITVTLKDQFGNAFAAPNDLNVNLSTNNSGTFYDKPSNGNQISSATIAKGQSGVKVYYVPDTNAVGTHKLTFSAPQVLSDGTSTGDQVTAEATINVGTGAGLSLVVELPTFTAGQRGEVTITVKDGHGNDVAAGQNGRVVYLETASPTGKFYAAAEGGDPITQVTIPTGQASVKVYYLDTESWTKKAMADGKLSAAGLDAASYSYTLAFRSEGVIGYSGKATVSPVETKAITLDLAQQAVDAVPDNEWVQIGSKIGATDLIGVAYMRVGVVDQYGNPVPQNGLLRISVKDDAQSAFLYWDYAGLENGEWAEENDAWLVVTAPGTYSVTATAGGLSGAGKQVTFEQPALEITAPAAAQPDTRIPVTIALTNLWASGRGLTVSLSTGTESSAFYADEQSAEPITQVTIPAYGFKTTVYLESDDPLGTAVELTASIADLNLTAQATVNLSGQASGTTQLLRGWNIISTPWELADGSDTIDKILANPDYVEQAYGYADGQWYLVTAADPATMKLRPLEALYVKLKGATDATFWAKQGLGTPPVRDLDAGWNLVGNPADEDTAVNEAFSSITGSYAVVISPAGCNQNAWVYTPQTASAPQIKQYRGCWVYMTKADRLAGQAMPPLQ